MNTEINVLVIDDDESVARSMARQLASLGHQVQVRTDPLDGLELARQGGFQIVMCDLMMPHVDGLEFLQRAQSAGLTVPVIVVTGDAEVTDIIEAHRLGAADFLLKPVTRVELRTAVERVLGLANRHRSPAARPVEATPEVGRNAPSEPTEEPEAELPSESGGLEPQLARMRGQMLHFLNTHDLAFPVPPRILARLSELSELDDPDTEEVIQLLEANTTLGRAVMRAASATDMYRGQNPPTSIRDAATRLGTLRSLANATSAAHRGNYTLGSPALNKFAHELWLSHFLSSHIAEALARRLDVPNAARLQSMVLFMEVGELAILRIASELWPDMFHRGRPNEQLAELMRRTHAEIGSVVLRQWRMPADYVELTRLHAQKDAVLKTPGNLRRQVALARLARKTVRNVLGRSPLGEDHEPNPQDALLFPKIGEDELLEAARQAVGVAREVLTS